MSTKIYTGFKINTTNYATILKRVHAFREILLPLAEKKMDDFVGETVKASQEEKAKKYDLWKKWREEIKKTGMRNPLVDTQFDIVFFPRKDCSLGMTFSDTRGWHELWLEQRGVSDFHYQNQTDEPEGMSMKEWRSRAKMWDAIFKMEHVPAVAGFTISVINDLEPYPKPWRTK